MPDNPIDSFARHLALLLSVVDIESRLRPAAGATRRYRARSASCGARRMRAASSYFEIEGGDDDEGAGPEVTRVARSVERDDGIAHIAAFAPSRVALLLASSQTGAAEAIGPPRRRRTFFTPTTSRKNPCPRASPHSPRCSRAARAVGVLEAARGEEGPPFDGDDLEALEDAASMLAELSSSARRERTVEAVFADLLPELFDRERAPTSLPARLRTWLADRRLRPDDREALGLAVSIAELGARSPAATALGRSIVAAVGRAFAASPNAWGALDDARR